MPFFSRKTPTPPAEPRIPSDEEIAAAGRALQVRGDSKPADRLCAEAGPHSQAVAMQILAACVDYGGYNDGGDW